MILSWLKQEFLDRFVRNPDIRVILWFDERREFERLIPALEASLGSGEFRLLRYDQDRDRGIYHGQLWLKAKVSWAARDWKDATERRFVLYLPFAEGALDRLDETFGVHLEYLLEYRYSGEVWRLDGKRPTLFAFLRKCGVPLPTEPRGQRLLWDGGRDSLLAKLAAKFPDRNPQVWTQPLDHRRAEELLVGDLDDRLFQVLLDPRQGLEALKRDDLLAEVLRQVEAELGFDGDLVGNAQEWAHEFTARLALTEAFETYGHPDDFPFPTKVAGESHRERCLGFLRKWWRDRDLAQAYVRLSGDIEASHRLDRWAEGRTGRSHAFRHVAAARWEGTLGRLSAAAHSKEAALGVLGEERDARSAEAQGFWAAQAGQLPGWASLDRLAQMAVAAQRAEGEAASCGSPADFAARYAGEWHQIDLWYWTLLRDVRAQAGLEVLANVADLFYPEYVAAVNGAFYDSLMARPAWPAAGGTPVEVLAKDLWNTQGPRAVVMVDALRYDLAVELRRLMPEFSGELRPILANCPTETGIGMPSLLPRGQRAITATVSGTGIQVRDGDSGIDIGIRGNREKLLAERVKAVCLDLDDVLSRDKRPQPFPSLLVVTEAGVDDIGHKTGANLIDHFDVLLRKLRHAVEKLARWGYTDIHLVTDHGFLLFRRSPEDQRIPIQEENCAFVSRRYAVLRAGVPTQYLSIPLPFAPEHRMVFPRGIRCFKAATEYMHEGLTLQEAVVPHLVIRVPTQVLRIGIEVRPRVTELSVGTFKLDLIPLAPPQQDLYAPPPAGRTLRVFLATGDHPVSRDKTVEVPSGVAEPISVTLFVRPDVPLRAGTELAVLAEDVEGKERFVGKAKVLVTRDF